MSKKKGLIIGGAAVGAAALLIVPGLLKTPELPTVRTMTLAPTTLSNTVSVTGTVESSNSYQVYSTAAGLIEEVLVKVGDRVQEGDTLCLFDSETLELNIAQTEASLDLAKNAAYLQLRSAQRNLNNAKENLANGLNSTIISAESGVSSAKIGKQNARLALESAENGVEKMEDALDQYRDAYKAAKKAEQEAGKAVTQYKDEYETLMEEFDSALSGLQDEIDGWKGKVDALEEAEKKLELKNEALAESDAELDRLQTEMELAEEGSAQWNELKEAYDKECERNSLAWAQQEEAQETYDALKDELKDVDPMEEIKRLNEEYTAKLLESGIAGIEAQTKLQAASEAYSAAASAKAQTQAALESAAGTSDSAELAVEQAQLGVKSANNAYNTALKQQEATKAAMEQQLESYEDAVASAQLQGNTTAQELALEQLYLQLENYTVTAPISGTITAVYAVEGSPSSGLLFIIEDIDDLEISTSLKEYDVNAVRVGMPAVIRTDAIDGAEFAGTLSEVAPTASKDAMAAATGSVMFGAVVDVDEQDTGLRVGMNTRMEIVLESKEDTFGIPYDAVHTAEDGSSFVVAVVEENGQQITRYIPVSTGMETDFYIEILSDELTEGLRIIASGDLLPEGTAVQVN